MEPLPHWLEVAVAAAGMTAYADDWDRNVDKTVLPGGETVVFIDPPGTFH